MAASRSARSSSAMRFRRVLTSYTAARLNAYQRPSDQQSRERAQKETDEDQAVLWRMASSALYAHPKVEKVRPAALSAIYVVASVVVISMMIDYDRPQSGFIKVDLTTLTLQLQSMQRQP